MSGRINTDPDCHKCKQALIDDGILPAPRMIVCPICGNKRCPKASDHTLDCTGSNEPGQPGSIYGVRRDYPGQEIRDTSMGA